MSPYRCTTEIKAAIILFKAPILMQKAPLLIKEGTVPELKASIFTLKALVLVQKAPVLDKKAAKGQLKAAKHSRDILECFFFYTNMFGEQQMMDKFVIFFVLKSKPTRKNWQQNSGMPGPHMSRMNRD